jgi:hypothetical protein
MQALATVPRTPVHPELYGPPPPRRFPTGQPSRVQLLRSQYAAECAKAGVATLPAVVEQLVSALDAGGALSTLV